MSLAFLSLRSVDWRMVLGLVSTLFILLFFYHTNYFAKAIPYRHVFITWQTHIAHQKIFGLIDSIVKKDTGSSLRWHHLHVDPLEELTGILHLVGDQHGGQAKGSLGSPSFGMSHSVIDLGLHLKIIAAQLPQRNDLHEPHCTLVDLDVFDHLHYIFRLCTIHFYQNIHQKAIPETVKNKIWSLACVEHPDFEHCLWDIEVEGGKTAASMLEYSVLFSTNFLD